LTATTDLARIGQLPKSGPGALDYLNAMLTVLTTEPRRVHQMMDADKTTLLWLSFVETRRKFATSPAARGGGGERDKSFRAGAVPADDAKLVMRGAAQAR
jgi:hypothetical protein